MSASIISKRKIILWLGAIIAVMPILGFPSAWKDIFYFVAGVLIAWNSYQLNKHRQVKQRKKSNKKREEITLAEEKLNNEDQVDSLVENQKEESIENRI